VKLLHAEYSYAICEIVIIFINASLNNTSILAGNQGLTSINNAVIASPINNYIFFIVCASIIDNLILTTTMHISNKGQEDHLQVIEEAIT
jgi:hypothetical protein